MPTWADPSTRSESQARTTRRCETNCALMCDERTIKLSRDVALVLSERLDRMAEHGYLAFIEEAERAVLDHLLALLEVADDGTAFLPDYIEHVAAARERLRPPVEE